MTTTRHVVVMVTSSYPRFPGDTIATFIEPIAQGMAERGHEVHVVLPWHPELRREAREGGVHFHPFRYAPTQALHLFGYATALKADVHIRPGAYLAAPLGLAAGWRAVRRVTRETKATLLHAHWVVPSGAVAAAAAGSLPLVISLHGSDVYLAERHAPVRMAARAAFNRADWVTACSDDLLNRSASLGASADRSETVPYGVDASRFKPCPSMRAERRRILGVTDDQPVLFTAGRFVRKKGFEHLVDATAELVDLWPTVVLILAGGGDLEGELRQRAETRGVAHAIRFVGVLSHADVASYLSAADVAVVPSVLDDAGNVDGLPNIVMEALASGTPLVATTAGGIPSVATSGRTAELVPEANPHALASAIDRLLRHPELRLDMGRLAREDSLRLHSWERFAQRLDEAYERATLHRRSVR